MRWFGRRDRDYREELETHIEIEVRENLERGMSPAEARAAAMRTFGNALSVREGLADERPLHFFATLARDIRYGIRLLRRSPGLTAAVVMTLALAIGANTAIFSLVEAVILRTLPVRDPGSLVIMRSLNRQGSKGWLSHADYEYIRDRNRVFSDAAATTEFRLMLDAGDHREPIRAELVSGNYFEMLGLAPASGREITRDDDLQRRMVAVISFAYWQRAFGGGAAVGKQIRIDKSTLEIIGVAPAGFRGEYDGPPPDVWMPLSAQPTVSFGSMLNTRNASWLGVLARLRRGVGIKQAHAAMPALLDALQTDLHVDRQNDYLGSIAIEAGGGGLSALRDYYAQPLALLMALVSVVMLIACANVANLLLARAAARRKEFAVRLAIGAGRARLVRQLLTESFLLAGLACAAGLGMARAVARLLVATADVKGIDVQLNGTVLAFTAAISCGAAIAFGLAPALQGRSVDPWTTLKDGKLLRFVPRRVPLSSVLVVAQTALSVVLVIAAGLLLRTFWNLKLVNPGFDQAVLQARLDPSQAGMPYFTLGNKLVQRLTGIAGVETAAYSGVGFGNTERACCFAPEGYLPRPDEDRNVRLQGVSSAYFHTMGIALLRGREFTSGDHRDAPQVAILNETVARHYFPEGSPLGKRFSWRNSGPKNIEIVGVVKDAKYDDLKQPTPPMVYLSVLQNGGANFLEIRSAGRPAAAVIADCRAAVRAVAPGVRVISFAPLRAEVDRSLAPERLVSFVSAGFGLVALVLTAVGLYGILAYTVARRTAEFGIRAALGAQPSRILRMVMTEGMVLVAIGLAGGVAAALPLSGLIRKLLFGVQPDDIVSIVAAAALLTAVAVLACYGPARRATAVEPLTALRYE
jgi:predicted permease